MWLLALRAEAAWIGGRFFPVLLQQGLAPGSGALDAVREAAARVAESGMAEQVAVPIDATEIESDSLLYGVGIDYFMDASVSERLVRSPVLARSFFLLQLIEEVIFDHDSRLIADQVEHVLGFTFRQAFRDERILTEVKVAYAPNHGDYYVWPELTCKLWPRCHLQLGARFLGGSRTQPIGRVLASTTGCASGCASSSDGAGPAPQRRRHPGGPGRRFRGTAEAGPPTLPEIAKKPPHDMCQSCGRGLALLDHTRTSTA